MPVIDDRKKWSIDNDFILSQYDPVPWTIVDDGIEADEYGMKYAHKGDFIDADGKVITLSDGGDSLTFSAEPVGILTERANVTYGPVVKGILQHGLIQAEFLNYPEGVTYKPEFDKSIKEKLPLIQTYGTGKSEE